MAKIFISYSRADFKRANWLAEQLERAGHEVWFDQDIRSGQDWWDEILLRIREAMYFVALLGESTMQSVACELERQYADDLGLTCLPVRLDPDLSPNLLPTTLSKVQLFDFFEDDSERLLDFLAVLRATSPRPELPDPLPEPPVMPVSYLTKLGQVILGSAVMDLTAQLHAVAALKRGVKIEKDRPDAIALLKNLRKRRDLLASSAEEIDKEDVGTEAEETSFFDENMSIPAHVSTPFSSPEGNHFSETRASFVSEKNGFIKRPFKSWLGLAQLHILAGLVVAGLAEYWEPGIYFFQVSVACAHFGALLLGFIVSIFGAYLLLWVGVESELFAITLMFGGGCISRVLMGFLNKSEDR